MNLYVSSLFQNTPLPHSQPILTPLKNRVHIIKEGSVLSSPMKIFSPKSLLLGPIHCRIRSSRDRCQTPSTVRVFHVIAKQSYRRPDPSHRSDADWWVLHKETGGDHTFHSQQNHWKVPYLGLAVRARGIRGGCLWLIKRISERRNRRHKI